MKKSELKSKAEMLFRSLQAFDEYYQHYLRKAPGLGSISLATSSVSISLLRAFKDSIPSYLKDIEKLPDDIDLSETGSASKHHKTMAGHIVEQLTEMEERLKEMEGLATEKIRMSVESAKSDKAKYEELLSLIHHNHTVNHKHAEKITYPPSFFSDSKFEAAYDDFTANRETFSSLLKGITDRLLTTTQLKEQDSVYEYGLKALEKYHAKYEDFHQKLMSEADRVLSTELTRVNKEQNSVKTIYDDITSKLSTLPPELTEPIKGEIKELSEVKANLDNLVNEIHRRGLAGIDSLRENLTTLDALTKEFTILKNKVQKHAEALLATEISRIRGEILQKRQTLSDEIRDSDYKFNESEKAFLTKLNRIDIVAPTADVFGTYDKLKTQEEEVKTMLTALERTMVLHRRAYYFANNFAKAGAFSELIKEINTAEGGLLLGLMHQYMTSTTENSFLKDLDRQLSSFTTEGRQQILHFIEACKESSPGHAGTSSLIQKIEEKLIVAKLLADKGIDPKSYIDKPHIIKAMLQLHEVGLDNLITKDVLSDNFCHTLTILKTNDIAITEDMVVKLKAEPDRCAIIYQQALNHGNKGKRYSLDDTTFKALLEELLKADPAVVQTVNIITAKLQHEIPTIQAGHWLLILAKENAAFRQIVCNEDQLNNNMPFLLPMMKALSEAPVINLTTWVQDYLGPEDKKQACARQQISTAIEPYDTMLKALNKASKNPADYQLPAMSKLMQAFTTVVDELTRTVQPDERLVLRRFYLEAIPLLLTEQPIETKQSAIESLAREHFQERKGLLRQVLSSIISVFQGIISYLAGVSFAPEKPEYFDQVKTGVEKAVKAVQVVKVAREALQEMRAGEEAPPDDGEHKAP
jgi:hypothetical protein